MSDLDFDTIIIGAGSAGCVLASRLSEDPKRRVLLLEAGPTDRSIMFRIPVGNFRIIGNSKFDWCFRTEPEPQMNNRRMSWPRGKVLGGSSAINGLIAIRGQPEDYDAWRAMGCTGWAWNDVLPYFKKLENFEGESGSLHNSDGPLPVSKSRNKHVLCDAYITAATDKLGVPPSEDFNGLAQEGVGYYHVNVSRGKLPVRVSAAAAYLKDRKHRPNLTIITGALVHNITFEGRKATGIIFEVDGLVRNARAKRQVVLSAGVVGSPHILQLSGIGDAAHLRDLGIKAVNALPGVGQNLQDHLMLTSVYRVNTPSVNDKVRTVFNQFLRVLEGVFMGTGAYYGVTNFGIHAKSSPSVSRPDLQFHVHAVSGSIKSVDRFSGMSVSGYQLRPESRGHITIRSNDPHMAPAIYANYLDKEIDRQAIVKMLRISRDLATHPAVAKFIEEERKPGLQMQTDEQLLAYARQNAETVYHPVGTCRMGIDDDAVVDARLRVHGVDNLYVADASIMPNLVSGNTHLPSVMIGEKAADMIIADERNKLDISPARSSSEGLPYPQPEPAVRQSSQG